MRVAAHQPNYLPWTGFFHKMANCDVFVILDNVQFPRRDFCNRTRIKSPRGAYWLTLPVVRGAFEQKINETRLFEPDTNLPRHLKTLHHFYARAPFYNFLIQKLLPIYEQSWEYLLPFNLALIKTLAAILGITTPLVLASSLGEPPAGKSERLIYLCQQLGADTYLSGRGAVAYNDPVAFAAAGLKLEYQSFTPPVYPQGYGIFIPNLSIVDLIMYHGSASQRFLCT
ncbi:WbqC family protein [Neomoorella thermoacetica]|uniref:WbqC family protein n=1 Tax=Neomoorella thermoacetica TaxID=1525 RepID=UPI0008F9F12A|nr:WbqC family protein [Moorella thermoacetica]OIQ12665.1 WbqC-like protein family protein [Moorella thermoacetica]